MDDCLAALLAAAEVLRAVPAGPIEPPVIRLALEPALAGLPCRVVAPPAVTAETTRVHPDTLYAAPGSKGVRVCTLSFDSDSISELTTEEFDDFAIRLIAPRVVIDAVAPSPGAPHVVHQLVPRVIRDAALDRIVVLVDVPADAPSRSSVRLAAVEVAGRSVIFDLSISVSVRSGILAPLTLKCSVSGGLRTPTVSPSGTMYVPGRNFVSPSGGIALAVFSFDGAALSFRLEGEFRSPTSTAFCGHTNTLFLADAYSDGNRITALCATTYKVRWATALGAFKNLTGLAVLEASAGPGVVFASSFNEDLLHVHRVSDGARVASVQMPPRLIFLATEPVSGTVYASVEPGISILRWDGAGSRLLPTGAVKGVEGSNRPIAVVKSAAGTFLVVSSQGKSQLDVFSVPSHELVHTHNLVGANIVGIAADPISGALLVCDAASGSAIVLEWPLPGWGCRDS